MLARERAQGRVAGPDREWARDGRREEAIVAAPSVRGSGARWRLSASVPKATAEACPRAAGATVRVVEDEGLTLAEKACPTVVTPPVSDAEIAARASAVLAGHPELRVVRASACSVVAHMEGEGQVVGVLSLVRPGAGGRVRSKGFEVSIETRSTSPRVLEALVLAAHDAVARDDGSLFAGTPAAPSCGGSDANPGPVAVAAVIAAIVALALGVLRRGRVSFGVRLPHALPAAIQVSIFTYWALYWPPVIPHARAVGAQLLLAFALDAAFSFARFGSWRVGLALLPVVLSANLFAWLGAPGAILFLLVAVGSKALVRRGGKHVFNPSAAGLAVAGAAALIAPSVFTYDGLFHTTNLPPNTTELVLLLALAPQIRFPIVLVSLGAIVGIRGVGLDTVSVSAPLVVLAIALLATDPATIPSTPAGRLFFGLVVGVGTAIGSFTLVRMGQPDDFAKVFAIPVANALVPWLDRLGARIRWRWLDPKLNRYHVAAWLVIVTWYLYWDKPTRFEGRPRLHLGHAARGARSRRRASLLRQPDVLPALHLPRRGDGVGVAAASRAVSDRPLPARAAPGAGTRYPPRVHLRRALSVLAAIVPGAACAREPPPASHRADKAGTVELSVRVPAGLRIAHGLDTLSVSVDPGALAATTVVADAGMVVGIEAETFVFPVGGSRPATGTRDLRSGQDFDVSASTWSASQGGVPARGTRYVVEMRLVLFETDVPPGHMWDPHAGRYRVLLTRTLRQAEE